MPRQVKQIANRLQRIIDLMGDRGRQASRGGQLLIPAKGILRALLCGYVSDDCRISYNRSARPPHGRDRHQHLHSPSVTADTLSLVTSNAFPLVETSKIGGNLLPALGR